MGAQDLRNNIAGSLPGLLISPHISLGAVEASNPESLSL